MVAIQLILIFLLTFKIGLEIECIYLKRKLHRRSITVEMKNRLDLVLYDDDHLKIVHDGKYYAYDFYNNQIIIKNENFSCFDDYCIILHEYGHYKDIYNKKEDLKKLLILTKSLIPILFVIIICLMIGNCFFEINHRFLLFVFILELLMMTIDFIMTIRLEFVANKYAISILKQDHKYSNTCMWFYYCSMLNQIIDRFFLILTIFFFLIIS